MYTKVYNNEGNSVVLTDGNTIYTLEYLNGVLNLYSGSGDSKVLLEFDEDEPVNELKYLNVTLVHELLCDECYYNSNIISNVSTSQVKDNDADVVFPFVNFRFKDGSRDTIYFCIPKNVDETLNTEIESYSNTFKYEINIKPRFKTVDTSLYNYLIVPSNEDVKLKITKGTINEDVYCNVATIKCTKVSNSLVYTKLERVPTYRNNLDIFNLDSLYEDVGGLYFNSDTINGIDLYKMLPFIRKPAINGANAEFYSQTFINGSIHLFDINYDENKLTYIGTCSLERGYPKVISNVYKLNDDDKDYVVNDKDRSLNIYNISNGGVDLGNSVALFKTYLSCDNNTFDVPKYNVGVSSYLPKEMVDEGYIVSSINASIYRYINPTNFDIILNKDTNIPTETGFIDGMFYRCENFKANYDINGEVYKCMNLLSEANLQIVGTYYIKKNAIDLLDYGEDSININDDTRIVYSGV